MATDDHEITEREFLSLFGDDTPPVMASVPEPPPSHWGVTTSTARTLSPQYIEFLNRHRENRNGRRDPS